MHNWSTDIEELKKDKEKFAIWRLEQMINFGTDREKIPAEDLLKYWEVLTLDEAKRQFMGFLLWGEKFLAKDKQNSLKP